MKQKLKGVLLYLLDTRILLGIGIGILIGVAGMISYKVENSMSNAEIEKKALDLGMIYKDESKISNEGNE
ncbi:MAG: hypothetical protein GX309_10470 [Clostridiales bacterium]|nr:hypothetical protein [Clostridiales bacterium]